jgi:hypothetical protein
LKLNSLSFLNNTCPRIDVRMSGKEEEVETQTKTVITLGLDQITKFLYRLDGTLDNGNV